MRRHRLLSVLAGIAIAAVLAGCGGTTPGRPDASVPSGNVLDWVNKVCEAVRNGHVGEMPAVDSQRPAVSKESVMEFLQEAIRPLKRLSAALEEAGEPPVLDGPKLFSKAKLSLGDSMAGVIQARRNLLTARISTEQDLLRALTTAREKFASLDMISGVETILRKDREIDAAFARSPVCRQSSPRGGVPVVHRVE